MTTTSEDVTPKARRSAQLTQVLLPARSRAQPASLPLGAPTARLLRAWHAPSTPDGGDGGGEGGGGEGGGEGGGSGGGEGGGGEGGGEGGGGEGGGGDGGGDGGGGEGLHW